MLMVFVLAQQEGASPNMLTSFLPIILIIGIFYLLIYRPMKRRQKNHEEMLSNLKNGDKVITTGGLYGTVAGLRESSVVLRVSEQVKVEVAKSAIASKQVSAASSSDT